MAISVRKHGAGWEYTFDIAPTNGKRKRKSKGGFKTKAEAQKAGAKAYSEYIQTGILFTPSDISISDYMDFWLENYVKINCIKSTYNNYKKKIRLYITPTLGSYYLKNINASALQNLINDLFNKGLSRNTLTVIKGIITNSMSYAVEPAGFISSSPAIYIKLPASRAKSKCPTKVKKHIYVEDEIWAKIIDRFPENHPSHLPLILGYKCGFRISETFGLMWSDIDFDAKTITIQRQIDNDEETKQWTFKAPKYNSYRTIDIDQELCNLLLREKEKQEKNQREYGPYWKKYYIDNYIPSENDYLYDTGILSEKKGIPIEMVLVRENGSYITSRTMQHVGRVLHGKANESAKKKRNKPVENAICAKWDYHSLRHTHATKLLEMGIPLPLIQDRLGHADIDITERYTNHVSDNMKYTFKKQINEMYK